MTKIRVYTQSINPFTVKVELALALKQLSYEREVSDDPEDLKRWSPVSRELPVADIDGKRVQDSGAILRELDRRFPETPLLAVDPKTARAQQRLAEWSDSSFGFYWNRWREARFPRPGDQMPADNPSLLGKLRGGIAAAFGGHGSELSRRELREAEVINEVAGRLSDLSAFLGDREFYYADVPSVADVAVYGMLLVLHDGPMTGARELIDKRPELLAFMKRMDDRTRSGLEHPALALPQP